MRTVTGTRRSHTPVSGPAAGSPRMEHTAARQPEAAAAAAVAAVAAAAAAVAAAVAGDVAAVVVAAVAAPQRYSVGETHGS